MIIIALFVLSMSANAQTTTYFNGVDTIHGIVDYTNTFDDIELYHESDWMIAYTESDEDGNWIQIYYNDTSLQSTMYIYYMTEELCWRMITLTDLVSIQAAERVISAK